MKKSDLPDEQIEKINLAVENGLKIHEWDPIKLLHTGMNGVPVYKIKAKENYYVVKLENTQDKNFDLARSYEILETVSKQGLSPKIIFTDPGNGIVLMEYIEPQAKPVNSKENITQFAKVIRECHDNNSFKPWISVTDIVAYFYRSLHKEHAENLLIKKCFEEMESIKSILFDSNDVRSCHGDLNPGNILYHESQYYLIDWQAASPQSLYFDLACVATWFYYKEEEFSDLLLVAYFDRRPSSKEKAKYYLMQVFTKVFFGIVFISLAVQKNPRITLLSELEIKALDSFEQWMQIVTQDQSKLNDPILQQQFGFVLLREAERMMNQKYLSFKMLIAKW